MISGEIDPIKSSNLRGKRVKGKILWEYSRDRTSRKKKKIVFK